MACLRLALSPLLQVIALVLVLVALVSPVPSHSSAVSLVYVSPMPLDATHGASQPASTSPHDPSLPQFLQTSPSPSAPPRSQSDAPAIKTLSHVPPAFSSTQLAAREVSDSDAQFGLSVTYVQYKAGLLGDCFTDANQTQTCSSPSMQPEFDPHALTHAPGVESDVRGLLTSLTYPAPLILFSFLLAVFTTGLQVRRVYAAAAYGVASPMACGPAVGRTLILLRIACYIQDVAGIIVIATILALRVAVAHSVSQFNSDNGERALGKEAFHSAKSTVPMAMHAEVGTAFGCLVIAGIFLLIVARIEHRRLRAEGQHVHPHADAVHGGHNMAETSDMSSAKTGTSWSTIVDKPLSTLVRPARRSISYPIPLHQS